MHNNLDDEMKVHLKQEESKKKKKEKKKNVITFMIMTKNSYKNIRKKERKLCLIAMCFCTTDFKKIKTTLLRSCDEEYFISLASKR